MSWVISLGGLAVAALALYLNYRERTSAHRIALYARQLDAYQEIAVGAAELVARVELLIASMGWNQPGRPRGPGGPSPIDNATENALRVAVQNASLDLSEIRVRHAVFVPDTVIEQVSQLETLATALLSPEWEIESDDGETVTRLMHKDPMFAFVLAQFGLFNDIRTLVGTDKLSKQTMSLLGARLREPWQWPTLPKAEGHVEAESD